MSMATYARQVADAVQAREGNLEALSRAFVGEGRCHCCQRWTRAGVRPRGKHRWVPICDDCARFVSFRREGGAA